jgi:hypothetical protein
MDLKQTAGGCSLDLYSLGYEPVDVCCEFAKEFSDSINDGEFVHQQIDRQHPSPLRKKFMSDT